MDETADWLDETSSEPESIPEPEPEVVEPAPEESEVVPTPPLAESEPSASLDTDSEKRIDDLLKEVLQGSTLLVIRQSVGLTAVDTDDPERPAVTQDRQQVTRPD